MTWQKVSLVAKAVAWGFNVLFTDLDVVWLRDPLAYFQDKVKGMQLAAQLAAQLAGLHLMQLKGPAVRRSMLLQSPRSAAPGSSRTRPWRPT
jgi:uncharacterized caspase-like protein